MILRHHFKLWQVLTAYRHSILRKVWPRVLLTTAIGAVVAYVEYLDDISFSLTTLPFSIIGVALGIFLGFRTNVSYDRFWEARRLWGRLVNITRTFARQLELFVVAPSPDEAADFRRETVLKLVAYVHSFRGMLRLEDVSDEYEGRLTPEETELVHARRNPPNLILEIIAWRLRDAWRRGWIHDYHLNALDASLHEMTSIQGACERIKKTPVPFSYSLLIHRITVFYCLFLPFGIVDDVGTATPLVIFFISYAFLGLDEVGNEVEDPFMREPNDLPLDGLSRTIEIDLLQMVGESKTRPELEPQNGILS